MPPSPSLDQFDLPAAFSSICKKKLEEEVETLKAAIQKDDPQASIMSIAMLLALTICPAMLGTQEAIRQSQSKSKREEHRARRCNLVISCVKPSGRSRDINSKLVVLKDGKLYVANKLLSDEEEPSEATSGGYPFSGYFLPYPDTPYEGLVSTISDDPPQLNWIYVDKDTYEVKYGVRADAQGNITGPFDCSPQDRRMTLETWEGFAVVEEHPGVWALYFDKDDDGLRSKIPRGTRVLDVELTRREKKGRKPEPDLEVPQTLDEKMKQHKEQCRIKEEERQAFLARVSEGADAVPAEQPHVPEPAAAVVRPVPSMDNYHAEPLGEGIRHPPSISSDNYSPSLQEEEESDESETQTASVMSEDVSTWSGSGRHDARETATVASSILDLEDASRHAMAHVKEKDETYMKPYVEEQDDEGESE
ncbi:hypothetical protein G7046_g1287 [Stylonectria norvegica]|nr:hypothetical protein G7046_g1287 [Stylonectria norvegica]